MNLFFFPKKQKTFPISMMSGTFFLHILLCETAQIKKCQIWARLDSNQRPNDYESSALTAAPRALFFLESKRLHVESFHSTATFNLLERETGFEPANVSLEG
jgi:hypothetical protein